MVPGESPGRGVWAEVLMKHPAAHDRSHATHDAMREPAGTTIGGIATPETNPAAGIPEHPYETANGRGYRVDNLRKLARLTMRFCATVEAVYDFDEPITLEKVREVLESYNCSMECESIHLRVASIEVSEANDMA